MQIRNNLLLIQILDISFQAFLLRNAIIYAKEEEIEYTEAIQYCQELRDDRELYLKDVYFSELLRKNNDIIPEIKKIPKYKYKSDIDLKNKILKLWQKEQIHFAPPIDERKEILSYSGQI